LLEDIISWLIETVFRLGYPGIVILMAIESSIFPLPSEIVMPPAGVLVAQGRMDAVLVVLAGTVGSILGALANYGLAIWLGRPLLHRYSKYFLVREASLDKTEAFFLRHGEISTFVGRLLPVIRHLISLPAGLCRMPLARFTTYTALGAAIWCAILTGIGWYLGSQMETLGSEDFYRYSTRAVLIMLPVLVVLVAAYVFVQRRRGARPPDGSEAA
jgi:membrane protein DedA with SNARE-associated domain